MQISSPSFKHHEAIPSTYTCDGANINPALIISEVPSQAKSLVLIMDDPDVPKFVREDGLWVHWLMWNIKPDTTLIPENTAPLGIVGKNTRDLNAYGGPCPPDREHRYFFKLYALDVILDLAATADKKQLEQAMQGHIIEQTELIGVYNRKK
jgi:Raf kinase inhibitor-like YbhB/YbcL family protein